MGLTTLEVEIANPASPELTVKLELLVDSGPIYSVVPRKTLEALGIRPITKEEFRLANGEKITRERGGAFFKYAGKVGIGDVIFGEEGDALLMGALTLESLGFALDPIRRELKPIPMILGGFRPNGQ